MREGYKETAIGMIPQEWEAVKLGKFCKLQNGYAFQSANFSQVGFPIIRISNVVEGKIDLENNIVYYDDDKIPEIFHVNWICRLN
jgi:type I restriction enzyme S subunit